MFIHLVKINDILYLSMINIISSKVMCKKYRIRFYFDLFLKIYHIFKIEINYIIQTNYHLLTCKSIFIIVKIETVLLFKNISYYISNEAV